MRNKMIALFLGLIVLMPLFGFQQLEARRHCRSNVQFSFGINTMAPPPCYYQETYIVRQPCYGPGYCARPVYVRPVPPPCYQEVYVYPAPYPCYPPCYPW